MSYRSLGSDEVTLRNYRPVGRRKGNMSLSDPLAAGVVVDLHKPGLSGIRIRLPRRRLIFGLYFIKKKVGRNLQIQPPRASASAAMQTALHHGECDQFAPSFTEAGANRIVGDR